ncbi:hypothetical protein MLD38_037657 [Melastoma candidum]|uniref:Uncharacterized protein n=1 Tax=Melastoma candidum TaxID=119954 RepID=A0ACB9LPH6_9MYRT|nr:hypothetical protein MLD38_037657 [Melastoma candidum]
MPSFKTPFQGFSVKFSPFYPNLLLVTTAHNFGILGNHRLHVLSLVDSARPAPITSPFTFEPPTASTTSLGPNPTTPSSSSSSLTVPSSSSTPP